MNDEHRGSGNKSRLTESGMDQILFILAAEMDSPAYQEVSEAADNLSAEGIHAGIIPLCEWDNTSGTYSDAFTEEPCNTLYVTDSGELLRELIQKGLAVAGYLHGDNPSEDFHGATYLLSEPQYVDADSYIKIWQRLTGRPWNILETQRLLIREMTVDDLDANYSLYADADAQRFLEPPLPDRVQEKERLEAYIGKIYGLYGYGNWAVIEKASGKLIGRAGFEPYQKGQRGLYLGYLVGAEHRGKGFAFETCSALVRYAGESLGFSCVLALTDPGNAASIALLQKLGFVPDGEEETEKGRCLRYIVGNPIQE